MVHARCYSKSLAALALCSINSFDLILEVTQAPKDEKGLLTGDARLRWLVKLIRESMNAKPVFREWKVKALKAALMILSEPVVIFHRVSTRPDRQVAWFRDRLDLRLCLDRPAARAGTFSSVTRLFSMMFLGGQRRLSSELDGLTGLGNSTTWKCTRRISGPGTKQRFLSHAEVDRRPDRTVGY